MTTGSRIRSIFKSSRTLVVVILLGLLALSACQAGTGALARGWSGVAIADDILFVGSMDGRLVAVNLDDGSRLWDIPLETEPKSTGGFLNCAPSGPTSVAIYGTPAVADDLVYVGGYNSKIYAFKVDEASPRAEPRRVSRELNIRGPIVGGIIASEGKVYLGAADGKVYALDAADGFKEWDFETGDKIWATPVIDGNTLYIGSFDENLYALDISNGTRKWQFGAEGPVVSTPLVHDGTVYFGAFDRHFYALNASDGSLKWEFEAENWFWARPVIRDGVIYASSLDGKVYVLNAETGEKQLDFDLGSPVSSSPVMVGNKLVVVATAVSKDSSVVYTLDTTNNRRDELLILEEKVYAPITAGDGKVYIHTEADALYEIDVESGARREFDIEQKDS